MTSRRSVVPLLALGAVLVAAVMAGCGNNIKDISANSPWYRLSPAGGGQGGTLWFADASRGWYVGDDTEGVRTTSDGGKSWQRCTGRILADEQKAGVLPPRASQLPYPLKIVHAGDALYVAFNVRLPGAGLSFSAPKDNRAGVLVSRDEGKTWRSCLALPSGTEWVLDLCAPAPDGLYALCGLHDPGAPEPEGATYLLRSSDGGKTWQRLPKPRRIDGEMVKLDQPLVFVDRRHAWSACTTTPDGRAFFYGMLTSSDGGKSWSKVAASVGGGYLFALDATHAWLAGGAFADSGYQTTSCKATSDGGKSWQDVDAFKDSWVSGIYFSDLEHGWMIAGGIYATSDGGKTWVKEAKLPKDFGGGWSFCRAGERLFATSGYLFYARKMP